MGLTRSEVKTLHSLVSQVLLLEEQVACIGIALGHDGNYIVRIGLKVDPSDQIQTIFIQKLKAAGIDFDPNNIKLEMEGNIVPLSIHDLNTTGTAPAENGSEKTEYTGMRFFEDRPHETTAKLQSSATAEAKYPMVFHRTA